MIKDSEIVDMIKKIRYTKERKTVELASSARGVVNVVDSIKIETGNDPLIPVQSLMKPIAYTKHIRYGLHWLY